MNWKRIWSGAALAALFILIFDMAVVHALSHAKLHLEFPAFWQAALDGFFCAGLYAVARPRLGPGPKTALIVGTAIYFMKHGLGIVWVLLRAPSNTPAAVMFTLAWLKLTVATYLAGWQYIEKAP